MSKKPKSYKYLGFKFTPSGEISSGLRDLKERATRAYQKLKQKLGFYFRLHPLTTISLFDSLIKPILLYGSDFWGCLNMPKNNPIENMYMKFCKDLLGVQKQTSNIGTLLELGAVPIMFFGIKNCIKNWHRIHKKNEANSILLNVHKMATEHGLPWPILTKHSLDSIGIESESNVDNIEKVTIEKLKEKFHEESFTEINSCNSKLRTYAKLKSEAGFEKYIDITKNIMDRTAITKIRLSNHELMIEKGRHQGLEVGKRLCPFCRNSVENEQHFLIKCQKFQIHRIQFFANITEVNNDFNNLNEDDKFHFLLTDLDALKLTGSYLHRTFQIRKFLLENYKQNG